MSTAEHVVKVCFGGTFDPIHCGHIGSAKALAEVLGTKVCLLPNRQPVHRASPGANAQQRLAMLQLVCQQDTQLCIDSRELARQGPSYSVDTLESMRNELGADASLIWCLGMDAFAQLHTWHRWRELLQFCHLLVMDRPASELPKDVALNALWQQHHMAEPRQLLSCPNGGIASVRLPQFDVSATAIRRLLEQGKTPPASMLPAQVAQYIAAQNLYKVETN